MLPPRPVSSYKHVITEPSQHISGADSAPSGDGHVTQRCCIRVLRAIREDHFFPLALIKRYSMLFWGFQQPPCQSQGESFLETKQVSKGTLMMSLELLNPVIPKADIFLNVPVTQISVPLSLPRQCELSSCHLPIKMP